MPIGLLELFILPTESMGQISKFLRPKEAACHLSELTRNVQGPAEGRNGQALISIRRTWNSNFDDGLCDDLMR